MKVLEELRLSRLRKRARQFVTTFYVGHFRSNAVAEGAAGDCSFENALSSGNVGNERTQMVTMTRHLTNSSDWLVTVFYVILLERQLSENSHS